MSWLTLWRPSETRSLMNQAQPILRIHSLNAQESHEKELSYKSSTVSCCGENTQPENCSRVLVAAPAWAAWLLPWAKPWWGCRTQVNFSAQHWAGKHGWVARRWHSSLWHGAVCVCAPVAHPPLQPSLLPLGSAFPWALPSPVHEQKTPENQTNEQTVRADPECLWLVD